MLIYADDDPVPDFLRPKLQVFAEALLQLRAPAYSNRADAWAAGSNSR